MCARHKILRSAGQGVVKAVGSRQLLAGRGDARFGSFAPCPLGRAASVRPAHAEQPPRHGHAEPPFALRYSAGALAFARRPRARRRADELREFPFEQTWLEFVRRVAWPVRQTPIVQPMRPKQLLQDFCLPRRAKHR